MNFREILHTFAAVAGLLAAGTLVFPNGIASAAPYVVFVAGLVGFAINFYMGNTTSGVVKNAVVK